MEVILWWFFSRDFTRLLEQKQPTVRRDHKDRYTIIGVLLVCYWCYWCVIGVLLVFYWCVIGVLLVCIGVLLVCIGVLLVC